MCGGAGMAQKGGMGGGRAMQAGGMGATAHSDWMGGSGNMHSGAIAHNGGTGRPYFAEGSNGNHFDRGNHERGAAHEDHSHKRFAERDFDHGRDFDHSHRHRVFRNGEWFWAYGPGYYAYN